MWIHHPLFALYIIFGSKNFSIDLLLFSNYFHINDVLQIVSGLHIHSKSYHQQVVFIIFISNFLNIISDCIFIVLGIYFFEWSLSGLLRKLYSLLYVFGWCSWKFYYLQMWNQSTNMLKSIIVYFIFIFYHLCPTFSDKVRWMKLFIFVYTHTRPLSLKFKAKLIGIT